MGSSRRQRCSAISTDQLRPNSRSSASNSSTTCAWSACSAPPTHPFLLPPCLADEARLPTSLAGQPRGTTCRAHGLGDLIHPLRRQRLTTHEPVLQLPAFLRALH